MSKIDQSIVASGWKKASVGDILKIRNGFAFKSSDYVDDGIPIVRQSNLNDGIVGLSNAKHVSKKFSEELPGFLIKEGDLLVGMSGSLGKISRYLEKKPALQNQRTGLLVLKQSIDPRFAKLVLELVEPQIISEGKGIAVQNVSAKQIEDCFFPLPPFEIRNLLVDEVEKQYSRLDEAVASLARIQANLKRYKSAVLKAAVEGKLTEQWRKNHPEIEPADQLLKRILAERRTKWEVEELAKMKAKGVKPKDDSWKKKYKEPAGPDTNNLPELPEGWVWATYDQTGTLNLGRQRAPKYHSGPNMRQYLRVQNVFEDRIDLSDVMEMDFPPADFEKYELKSGDMLLNEGQSPELLGRPAIYRGELPGACFTNTLIRFRAVTGISVEFALFVSRYYMRTRRFLEEGTITTNIAHLSLGRLATIEFPLPCFVEQQTIVTEAERLISVTEELEATIETNLKRAERLRQTILQRAFSGELVP